MKKTLILAIVAGVMWTSSPDVGAVNYYVDATGGNDGNPGTEALPWLTLKKAGDTAKAGDTVCFKAGVYKGPLRPMNSGTADNYITFKTYGSDEVIIEGCYKVTGWTKHSGNIYKASWESSFLDAGITGINDAVGFVNVDYISDETHWLKPIVNIGDMQQTSWHYDIPNKILYVWLSDSSNPNNHTILSTKSNYLSNNIVRLDRADYVRFEGFKIWFGYHNIRVWGRHHLEFKNIEAYNAGHDSIRTERGSSDVIFDNIKTHHNKGHGIQINGSYSTIKNSEIHHNGIVPWSRWGGAGVILMGDHNTLSNSKIHHCGMRCWGSGLLLETWGTDGEPGPDHCHHNIVEYNEICGNAVQHGIGCSGGDNNKIRKNVIYGMNSGISIHGSGAGGSPTSEQQLAENNEIYNNVLVNNKNGMTISSDNKVINTVTQNNIFYKNSQYELWVMPPGIGNAFDYNDYYHEGGGDGIRWVVRGSHSIVADPEFVNLSGYDFSLFSASPCIDAGTDVGLPYNGIAPDIGVYEYSSASADTTAPKVTSFNINPTITSTNEQITIDWTVSDDKELKQVELHRTVDKNGSPDANNWNWIKTQSVSGTSASGSFTDSVSTAGTYWYGIHVVDQASNVGHEPAPVIVAVNNVVLEIPPVPTIPSFPDIQSSGKTYHVDKDIGSDSNTKAQAQNPGTPWVTIQYGVNQLSAGDTLIVHEGVTPYREKISISAVGTSENWVTIRGADGEAVTIQDDGVGRVSIPGSAKYVLLKNFIIKGIAHFIVNFNVGASYIALDNVEIDGQSSTVDNYAGILVQGNHHIWFRNMDIHHCAYKKGTAATDAGGVFISAGARWDPTANVTTEHITFIDVTVRDCLGDAFSGRPGIEVPHKLRDVYFERCKAINNTGDAFDIGCSGENVFRNCVAGNNGGAQGNGFKVWGSNVWFVNCLAYDNAYSGINPKPFWPTNVYILNCTLVNNWGGSSQIVTAISSGATRMADVDLYLYNNIFMMDGEAAERTRRAVEFYHTNAKIKGSDNNYFFSSTNARAFQFRDNLSTYKIYSLSDIGAGNAWNTDTGHGANSLARWTSEHGLSDPGFVNLAGDDYGLIEISLAVDAGTDVGVTADIAGAQRPQGSGYDVGAYEYGSDPADTAKPIVNEFSANPTTANTNEQITID